MRIFKYTGTLFPKNDFENQFAGSVKGTVIVEDDTWTKKQIKEKIRSQIFPDPEDTLHDLEIKEIPKLI
jgi:hypothetical protein